MFILQCATLDELFTRLKSSHQVTAWLAYLHLRDEEEVKKMKTMLGQK